MIFEDAAISIDSDEHIAKIDRWHVGYFAGLRGEPRPVDEDGAEGWNEQQRDRQVEPVPPRRPEGYYHAPLGTFD